MSSVNTLLKDKATSFFVFFSYNFIMANVGIHMHIFIQSLISFLLFPQGEKCKFTHHTIPLTMSKVNLFFV